MARAQSDGLGRSDGLIGREIASEHLHAYLKQVVALHQAMFEKLLFDQSTVTPELADLFEDAGTSYLRLARDISKITTCRY